MPETESRERVLNVAESLFGEKGYTAVTLKEIATALGMKQASLYFHFVSKEQLFITVMQRIFDRHRHGLEAALQQAEPTLRAQLQAASQWLLSQPALNVGRMLSTDMPAIDQHSAAVLSSQMYQATLIPLAEAFRHAHLAGEIVHTKYVLLAGSLLSIVEAVQNLDAEWIDGAQGGESKVDMVESMIDVFINGLHPRV
jgi:AcrR family transcriptional regulator